ncbi:MAG: hypothetical protein HY819_17000 [Acidobacteria bacterium]|nr:hypothetical protein [Acidobacteriota bacterium]
MFFSRLSKLAFILLLLSSISCERSTTANNTNNTAQTTKQASSSSTSQLPQGPPSAIQNVQHPMNKDEALKLREDLKNSGVAGPPSSLQSNQQRPFNPAPSPEEVAGKSRDNLYADVSNTTRSVIRYYNFLTDIRGLNLNKPKEMDGGASAFKAVDVLQFTFKNQPDGKPFAVLVAEFNNPKDQEKGMEFMKKMGNSQRKSYKVNNYSLLILGGDDKAHKILTDSLEQFR